MKSIRALLPVVLGLTATLLVVCLTDRPVRACFEPPQAVEMNIDTFLANADHNLNANHQDPQMVYQAARAHLLAAVYRTQTVTVWTWNDRQNYHGNKVTPGNYLSEAQAVLHFHRAFELLARLEAMQPEMQTLFLARGFMLEHCAEILAPAPINLSPLAPAETARWNAVIADLAHPVADTRRRAYRSLADQGDALLPVLADHLNNRDLGIRTQIRQLVQQGWRERALQNYRQAFDLYSNLTAQSGCPNDYLVERIDCGRACDRLIALHTATREERQWRRGFQKLIKQYEKLQCSAEPITPVECEG